MKKLLLIFLVILLVVPAIPVPANAVTIHTYGYFEYYENEDGVTLYKCKTTAPKGTDIPKTLGGFTVTEIGPSAFSGNKNLTEITVPNTVKRIGNSAFSSCVSLQKVTLPDSVCEMGIGVFSGSTALTEVVLPPSITEVPNRSFNGCTALTTVAIPQDVTLIGEYAFYNCQNLSNINIPQGVTTVGLYAFYKCSSLTAVNITDADAWCKIDFKNYYANPLYYAKNLYLNGGLLTDLKLTSNVEEIKTYVFYNCTSLKSVSIDNIYLASIGTQAFYGCSGITEFNITDLTEWCKTEIGGGYANPSAYAKSIKVNGTHLTELTIPYRIATVSDYAFYGADITSLKIPSTVKEIGSAAFNNCSSLKNVTLEDNLKIINSHAFYGCSALTQIDLPEELDIIGDYAFSNCSNLVTVTGGSKLTKIGENAFYNCTALSSFTAPDTLEQIGDGVFSNCTSLETVSLSKNVKTIGVGAFYGCSSLKKLSNAENIEKICKNAFYNCTALSQISVMPNLETICENAFYYCSALTEFTFPEGLKTIENNAFHSVSLTEVVLPDSLEEFSYLSFWNTPYFNNLKSSETGVAYNGKHIIYVNTGLSGTVTVKEGTKTIGYQAFANCSSITKIVLPSTLEVINSYAFYNCQKLTSLNIPASVKTIGADILKLSGIYNNTSNWTNNLLYLSSRLIAANTNISGSVSIKSGTLSIAEAVFKNCTSLETVTVPSGIKTIPESAFEGCSGLKQVNLPSDLERIEYNAFKDFNIYNLPSIKIPESVIYIDKEYLGTIQWVDYMPTIQCYINSAAEKNAFENGYPIEYLNSVSSLSINTLPKKLTYNTDDVLDLEGLTLNATVSNGKNIIVSDNYTVETCDMTAIGEKTVTVDFHGAKTTFNITVKSPKYPESRHPYSENTNKTYVYESPIPCDFLKITFSEDTVLENHWDWIYFYDSLGNIIGEYTGKNLAGKTIQMRGDIMRLGFKTDANYNQNGFKIENIRPVNPETAYGDLDENNVINAKDLAILRKLILKYESFTQVTEILSDMNLDGETDVLDLVKIKKSIAAS